MTIGFIRKHWVYAGNVVVSTSCSLLHTAVDLKNETKLDAELKSWLAFTAQKLLEVVALAMPKLARRMRRQFILSLKLCYCISANYAAGLTVHLYLQPTK